MPGLTAAATTSTACRTAAEVRLAVEALVDQASSRYTTTAKATGTSAEGRRKRRPGQKEEKKVGMRGAAKVHSRTRGNKSPGGGK